MAISLPTTFTEAAERKLEKPIIRLPYPYNTDYEVVKEASSTSSSLSPKFKIQLADSQSAGTSLPLVLHNEHVSFTDFDFPCQDDISFDNNTPWARARRAPRISVHWTGNAPYPDHIWLISYFIFTVRADLEIVRLDLNGIESSRLVLELHSLLLTVPHPAPDHTQFASSQDSSFPGAEEVLLSRATFWQGAASPVGSRPIWLPQVVTSSGKATSDYPITPNVQTMTTRLPDPNLPYEQQRIVHAMHPVRPAKPSPGSTIYSRYFPTLGEQFSLIVVDVDNSEHFALFHEWQNDPRVTAGWNESGSEDYHRDYLRSIAADPHHFAVFGVADEIPFAYFEFYWAKEDHLGPHWGGFDAFDRGRHGLVGNAAYRGPHRANSWWCSLNHFAFLDDPRTMGVVGEPRATTSRVLAYDLATGFGMVKHVDLLNKRSALMRVERERFFQLDASGASLTERKVAGTNIEIRLPLDA